MDKLINQSGEFRKYGDYTKCSFKKINFTKHTSNKLQRESILN